MRSQTSTYGFAHICPWEPKTFTYRGLCSHSSLGEGISHLELSPEQHEQAAWDRAKKEADYQYDYQRELRENPTPEYKARKQINNIQQADSTRARQQAAKASEKYKCNPYDVNCRDAAELRRHEGTRRHKTYVAQDKDGWPCLIYSLHFKHQSNLKQHQTSKGQLRRVEEMTGVLSAGST
ncbi:hypothetical protein CONLIGDRAFT_445789 [Coniochaeta ligniaria NRRL 30616]|uniref:Uncharacterized protein n=1 Tax=Coniochaeta ligniaria NRRL 30616 TaxID=1408157 RepID=A0A1J7IK91_9PEZI|nr:hypothetical protein CONLIGDRAFT_445789 [Coniochaeta ligniaria NRRL 30616]